MEAILERYERCAYAEKLLTGPETETPVSVALQKETYIFKRASIFYYIYRFCHLYKQYCDQIESGRVS